MKNSKSLKTLVAGIVIGVTLVVPLTSFATGTILKAEYNSIKVNYAGYDLELSAPLITIIDAENPANAVNYMPVRTILEEMGYEVHWNEAEKSIDMPVEEILNKVDEIKEPVAFRVMLDSLSQYGITHEETEVPGGMDVLLTADKLKASFFMPYNIPGAISTTIKCENKEAKFDLVLKEGRSFINEDEFIQALKDIGLIK